MPPDFRNVFDSLAQQFPVCMASDEFHFFPQAKSAAFEWPQWDDFTPDAISGMVGALKGWERQLRSHPNQSATSDQTIQPDHQIDAEMLGRALRTLREQFELVRVHETQPTFYLTIVGIGLAEAFEAGPEALNSRIETLPRFIDQALDNLNAVPDLFRDLGLEMLAKQKQWLASLPLGEERVTPVVKALLRLKHYLTGLNTGGAFLPSVDLYERIADEHMGAALRPHQIACELRDEVEETRSILIRSAEAMAPGTSWKEVIESLPRPSMPPGGGQQIYGECIEALGRHCLSHQLVSREIMTQCPVRVEPIPAYLRTVRSNAAYSMPPLHPPKGGTFFIEHRDETERPPADYRLLTAHETFPGHHLLDTCRWRHERPVRRHIEFPLFYEGWASFAEELMFETGFFSGPVECMLMAKRRFWRAMRGQADFDIHMRRRTPEEAAAFLVSEGLPTNRAEAMVRRYCLKPGYQLAYTIGRRCFRKLYDALEPEEKDPIRFARRVLTLGEIGFSHLEKILRQGD